MTTDALAIINDAMTELGLHYEFEVYTDEIQYPYFTGEYQEVAPVSEDGMQETAFILNGFTRGSPLGLEEAKEAVVNRFDRTSGHIVTTESGNVVAIFYDSAYVIPQEDEELKRMQINLTIKEWKVN